MMRKFTFFAVILLGSCVSDASAQQPAPKTWDLSATAAISEARPDQETGAYQDNWYFQGRYAAALGRYWNEHLKTEIEYARSKEGSVYVLDYRLADTYPYASRSFHRLEQGSVRMIWQFGRNAWVHPYVSGGLVVDRDRQRNHIPAHYQSVDGRSSLVMPDIDQGPTWKYRVGTTVGAGAKAYLSRNAFFNSGVIGTWSRPSMTLSAFAGFGFDF